jgi:hypothetical protein
MLEIFDHRPMLTAALTLTTTVLLVVVTLLIMLPQSTGPARDSGGGKPAGAAAREYGRRRRKLRMGYSQERIKHPSRSRCQAPRRSGRTLGQWQPSLSIGRG